MTLPISFQAAATGKNAKWRETAKPVSQSNFAQVLSTLGPVKNSLSTKSDIPRPIEARTPDTKARLEEHTTPVREQKTHKATPSKGKEDEKAVKTVKQEKTETAEASPNKAIQEKTEKNDASKELVLSSPLETAKEPSPIPMEIPIASNLQDEIAAKGREEASNPASGMPGGAPLAQAVTTGAKDPLNPLENPKIEQAKDADTLPLKAATDRQKTEEKIAPSPKAAQAQNPSPPAISLPDDTRTTEKDAAGSMPHQASAKTPQSGALREFMALPKPELEVPQPLQENQAKNIEGALTLHLQAAFEQHADGQEARPEGQAPAFAIPTGLMPPKDMTFSITAMNAATPKDSHSTATFAQLDNSIKWMLNTDIKGAELQLHPEALGRLVIQIKMEGGEVHTRLWASEPSTVPILQDQKSALENSLRQQGLQLGSFDLQQGRQDGTRFAQNSEYFASPHGPRNDAETPTIAVERVPSPSRLGGARLIEVFA